MLAGAIAMRMVIRTLLHNLTKLHGELLAAIAALRPTPTGPAGQLEAVMLLGDRGDEIMLQVPDEVTDEELDAVLDAHDPAYVPTEEELFPLDYGSAVPTRPQLKAGVDTIQGYIADQTPTAASTVIVVKLLCRSVLFIMRRLLV